MNEFCPTFRFKKFGVDDRRSALKVGTDGVLVGAWAEAPAGAVRMLDVGAGCGVIALMLAQRFADPEIVASEIDAPSVADIILNVARSPWPGRIRVVEGDFRDVDGKFDLIASNPPFFTNGELAPEAARARARHASALSPLSLVRFASECLTPAGRLAMIAPVELAGEIEAEAALARLCVRRRTDVATSPRRGVTRTLWELSKSPCIRQAPERLDLNSEDYRRLTRDFYLHF